MDYVEIEIKAKSVDLAVETAMQELEVEDREDLEVEVITPPVKGFLGMGGQDAVVRIKKRASQQQRSGRRNQGKSSGSQQKKAQNRQQDRSRGGKNGGGGRSQKRAKSRSSGKKKTESKVSDDRPSLPVDEQADLTREFLEGLVEAYGLEGSVSTRVDDEVIVADVEGPQTEAMVGVRGSVRSAIHELTRTVLQRYSRDTARLRLDIAGYAERRRKALAIYAEQLIEQLMTEGGEIMLEPMSPADRKVIHDVAAEHDGVTSYSEGEPPKRFVVLSRASAESEEE